MYYLTVICVYPNLSAGESLNNENNCNTAEIMYDTADVLCEPLSLSKIRPFSPWYTTHSFNTCISFHFDPK